MPYFKPLKINLEKSDIQFSYRRLLSKFGTTSVWESTFSTKFYGI